MSGQSRPPTKGSAPSKNKQDVIVIDDEEPMGGKPPEKRAKVEEVFVCPLPPSPSLVTSPKLSDVAVLQQKLEKSERMYQKACAEARKEQLRAEHAESLLDNKQDVKKVALDGSTGEDGLEKKLAEATKQLEASRERANNAATRNLEVARERDAFKGEVYDLRSTIRRLESEIQKRDQSGYYNNFNNSELSRDYFELKTNLDQAKVAEGNMTRAFTTARQENISLQIEIKELKRREEEHKKNTANEENIALKAEMEEMKRKEEEEKKNASATLLTTQQTLKRVLTTNGGAADLFQCCFTSTDQDSISLDDAVSKLQAKQDKCGKKVYQKYCCVKGSAAMNIKCAFCQVNIRNRMVDHFLMPKHVDNVRLVADATVSLPAVQHWLQHLQQAIEWKKEEEKEDEEEGEDNEEKSDDE